MHLAGFLHRGSARGIPQVLRLEGYEQGNIVAALDNLVGSEADSVTLDKLFSEGLGDGRRGGGLRGGLEWVGTRAAIDLRVEGLLSSRSSDPVGTELGAGHEGARERSRSGARHSGPELTPREDGNRIQSNGSPLPT